MAFYQSKQSCLFSFRQPEYAGPVIVPRSASRSQSSVETCQKAVVWDVQTNFFHLVNLGTRRFLPDHVSMCVSVCVSHLVMSDSVTQWTVAHQAPPSILSGFSRQEYWSGLPFPSPAHVALPKGRVSGEMESGGSLQALVSLISHSLNMQDLFN